MLHHCIVRPGILLTVLGRITSLARLRGIFSPARVGISTITPQRDWNIEWTFYWVVISRNFNQIERILRAIFTLWSGNFEIKRSNQSSHFVNKNLKISRQDLASFRNSLAQSRPITPAQSGNVRFLYRFKFRDICQHLISVIARLDGLPLSE